MKKNRLFIYLMAIAALFFTSCEKDPIEKPDVPEETSALLILSEGSFNSNNSTLANYNLETGALDRDYFNTVNQRGLGDTANDMLLYGSKVYIVVSGSNIVEVMNAKTGKSLKTITIQGTPRNAAAYNGKVYVTSFDDKVTRIDTLSLVAEASTTVGRDPEGICVANNKIYVANSGGLDYATGNFDSTVSVIDVNSFKEEKKIEVGKNPYQVFADSQGDIYVSTRTIYHGWTPIASSTLKKISGLTYEVETISGMEPSRFTIVDDKAYIIIDDYVNAKVAEFDCLKEKVVVENLIPADMGIATPYCISVDKFSGDVFLTLTNSDYSSTPGNMYCLDKDGKFKYKLTGVGVNPTVVIFVI